ncbi:MAG: hypothetical protein V1912_05175 [bacterium]
MRRLLKRKWLIPVAALILTLTISAVAWAATGANPTDSTTSPSANTPSTTVAAAPQPSGENDLRGPCGRGDRFGQRAPLTEEQKQALQKEQQDRQAKRDAALKLIRDKMSAADQAAFDQLQATATEQRAALQQAQQNLKTTTDQLRALVQEYGGVDLSGRSSSTTPGSGASTPSTGDDTPATTGSSTSI